MSITKSAKIAALKQKARAAYIAYMNKKDTYTCGIALANHISGGELERLAIAFDGAMDELENLGEPVPNGRLSNSHQHNNAQTNKPNTGAIQ